MHLKIQASVSYAQLSKPARKRVPIFKQEQRVVQQLQLLNLSSVSLQKSQRKNGSIRKNKNTAIHQQSTILPEAQPKKPWDKQSYLSRVSRSSSRGKNLMKSIRNPLARNQYQSQKLQLLSSIFDQPDQIARGAKNQIAKSSRRKEEQSEWMFQLL